MKRALCAALALFAMSTAMAQADTGRMNSTAPSSGYVQALDDVIDQLNAAAAKQPRGGAVPDVHVPPAPLGGPPRYSPSLDDWLQATLNAARADKGAKQRARDLRAAARSLGDAALAASTAQASVQPSHAIGPTVAAILADPAYHEAESTQEAQPHKSWWQLFLEWLAGLIDKLFGGLFGAAAAVPIIGRIVSAVTIALLALLVAFVVYRLARYALRARTRRATEDVGEPLAARADPAGLYAQAREAARRLRYAEAIALAFRASLHALDRTGVAPYDAALTAGQYRRLVRGRCAQAAPPFDEMAGAFTMATYAERPVGEHEWLSVDQAYVRFEPRLPRREVRAEA